jgi:M6 family metalloprotease-like protein
MQIAEQNGELIMLRTKTFLFVTLLGALISAAATETPQSGQKLPEAYYERLKSNPDAFKFKNGFLRLTAKAQEGREMSKLGPAPLGTLTDVKGHKKILVLLVQFSDTKTNPYEASTLSEELFGTNSSVPQPSTATLSNYYRENSYGKLLVGGDVKPWKRLSNTEAYYAGGNFTDPAGTFPCYGVCPQNSRVAELVEEATRLNDDPALWGPYDNDGPDDIPNSIDDDGKVDFLVIVHPGKGAECDENSPPASLWSHQSLLSSWSGHAPYTTKAKSNRRMGGKIQVDDYVLVPAVACDGSTPIQIGVIAHEFGHSLGLPDLYDTSREPKSEGLGNWDLMAGGAWGGDGQSPDTPVHMSAWSKAFLGWVKPKDVTVDTRITALNTFETTDDVFLITLDSGPNIYYLISNRQKIGFDAKIPGIGLLILRVDESVLKDGIRNNSVNTNPQKMGVAVVEADGLEQLIHHGNSSSFRGGPGDTFPGKSDAKHFDNGTTPATSGSIALCSISDNASSMSLRIFVSRGSCPAIAARTVGRSVSISELASAPQNYVNSILLVRGFLQNEVSNYFSDRPNLTLLDHEGNRIAVSPWLPKEIPPGLRGPGPPSLSQFLGHEVEFTGKLSNQESTGKYTLQVDSARIIQ